MSTSPQDTIRGHVGLGEVTSNELSVWTALDDHQLTRLLEQHSS